MVSSGRSCLKTLLRKYRRGGGLGGESFPVTHHSWVGGGKTHKRTVDTYRLSKRFLRWGKIWKGRMTHRGGDNDGNKGTFAGGMHTSLTKKGEEKIPRGATWLRARRGNPGDKLCGLIQVQGARKGGVGTQDGI